jgi:hypothetical protein
LDLLIQFLDDSSQEYDLLLLQSIGVFKKEIPLIPGFHYPPFITCEDNRIRTATYVRKNLQVTQVRSPLFPWAGACEVLLHNNHSIKVFNVYFPDGISDKNRVSWLADIPREGVIVAGDFNAHHSWWNGGDKCDKGGTILQNQLEDTHLCLLNDGQPTRIPDTLNQNSSVIDLTFVTSDLFCDSWWEVNDDPLGSDPLPINISLMNSSIF